MQSNSDAFLQMVRRAWTQPLPPNDERCFRTTKAAETGASAVHSAKGNGESNCVADVVTDNAFSQARKSKIREVEAAVSRLGGPLAQAVMATVQSYETKRAEVRCVLSVSDRIAVWVWQSTIRTTSVAEVNCILIFV